MRAQLNVFPGPHQLSQISWKQLFANASCFQVYLLKRESVVLSPILGNAAIMIITVTKSCTELAPSRIVFSL